MTEDGEERKAVRKEKGSNRNHAEEACALATCAGHMVSDKFRDSSFMEMAAFMPYSTHLFPSQVARDCPRRILVLDYRSVGREGRSGF